MNNKVYYRGNKDRPHEILKALRALGGIDPEVFKYNYTDSYYYIGENDIIACICDNTTTSWFMKQLYTEAFLPEEIIECNGKKYYRHELERALETIKPIG